MGYSLEHHAEFPLRASSVTPVVFLEGGTGSGTGPIAQAAGGMCPARPRLPWHLAWICCSRLCCIRMPMLAELVPLLGQAHGAVPVYLLTQDQLPPWPPPGLQSS